MSERVKLAVIVPVYHNAASLAILHERLTALEQDRLIDVEIIYVDDRSQDESWAVLREICESDPRARVIRLSRNFGSFTAIRAGLDQIDNADCVAIISADLQDPPEHLGPMFDAWRADNPVVLAVRQSRADANWGSKLYYQLLRRWALPTMPAGGFDFLLLDFAVAKELRRFQERNTSLMGLVLWMGYATVLLPYTRQARPYGRSMWSFGRKIAYFVDSFIAFTAAPLRLVSIMGVLASLLSFGWCGWVVFQALALGAPVQGWSSLMAAICFLGGVQLLGIGVLGEYLWRNLEESRRRPLYLVDETYSYRSDSIGSSKEALRAG